MSIASKEARKTRYWLRLFDKSDLTDVSVSKWSIEVDEIVKILTSMVKTTQKNS